ncbi:MAG: electron transfer flavoprotein subunit beta/FixA family protein [Deltaproteobacteria bacterium]|jgi:electron transfer flavoprotein beta subunit|nr:MAG: electron transfer flavoprotein subunit beta/FixA family protein [Deltaproteobacteria bacterium]
MDIVVCVKRVPLTEEVDLIVDEQKKGIKKEQLAFVLNDWDNYAIEEAIVLKEKHGGTVTAVTVGTEDDEEVLRRSLAMGADRAIRIEAGDMSRFDSLGVSRILCRVVKDLPFDLVFTGVLADDDYYGMVGMMMAEELGINHANMVTAIEIEDGKARTTSELEGGLSEVSLIELPALLTIQTGINEPRYVSILGIRKAAKKELKVMDLADLGLPDEELSPRTIIEEVFLPPETEGAQILTGDPDKIASDFVEILTRKGVME